MYTSLRGIAKVQNALAKGETCLALVWRDNPQGTKPPYIREAIAEDGTVFSEYGFFPKIDGEPWPSEEIEVGKGPWPHTHPRRQNIDAYHGGYIVYRRK